MLLNLKLTNRRLLKILHISKPRKAYAQLYKMETDEQKTSEVHYKAVKADSLAITCVQTELLNEPDLSVVFLDHCYHGMPETKESSQDILEIQQQQEPFEQLPHEMAQGYNSLQESRGNFELQSAYTGREVSESQEQMSEQLPQESFAYINIAPVTLQNLHQLPLQVLEEKIEVPLQQRKSFNGSDCGQEFKRKRDLHIHEQTHKQTKCDVCQIDFMNPGSLNIHKPMHSVKRPYSCSFCCWEFFEKSGNLILHIKYQHNGSEPNVCYVCGKGFRGKRAFVDHMTIHKEPLVITCKTCGKTFQTPSSLRTHERIHSGEKPFKCDVCGKGFAQQIYLTLHMRTHTGERPYTCVVCGKGFKTQSAVTQHTRTHTGERPYTCVLCGKGFTQNSSLTIHTRTHNGEMPYTCDVCGKGFPAKQTLTIHMRTHTGERPYMCDVCGKGFTYCSSLTTHMRTHNREKPHYTCDICHESFTSKSTLKAHIDTHMEDKV